MLPNSTKAFLGSHNRFSGEIPRRICELFGLQMLVLSNNNFNGYIPPCFDNFNTTLEVLHLQNNSLSGVFREESISLGLNVGRNQLSEHTIITLWMQEVAEHTIITLWF